MKKSIKKPIYICAMILAIALFLVGCGKKTIEDLVPQSELKLISSQMIAGQRDVYSDAIIEIKGNSIKYIFYFVDGIDVERTKNNLSQSDQLDSIKEQATGYFKNLTGIEPTINFEFRDIDGNLLYASDGSSTSYSARNNSTTTDYPSGNTTTEEPVYEEPEYEEPVYDEPVYDEPVYDEPVEEEVSSSNSLQGRTTSGEVFYYNTIEEYYNQPEIRETLNTAMNQLVAQYPDTYASAQIIAQGNDVIYVYYYVDGIDTEAVKKGFEGQDMSYLGSGKQNIYSDTKIEPDTLSFVYCDYYGNVIVKFEF